MKCWFHSNSIKLNTDKTKIILFSSQEAMPKSIDFGDDIISFSDKARNLGFIVDHELKFEAQIAKACRNSFYHLKLLSKNKTANNLNFCCLLNYGLYLNTS